MDHELEDSVKTPLAVSIKINKFFSNRWLKITFFSGLESNRSEERRGERVY